MNNFQLIDNEFGILKPQIQITYNREYFFLNDLRITFDSNIQYINIASLNNLKTKDKECVMEIKVNFRINDDGKISRMNVMDDQALWTKAYQAWDTRANGVIYKDHPLVTKVRLMMRDYETQDVEKIKSNYTENTRFYDVMNSPVDEFKSLEEEFAQFNDYMEVFELVNIRESGYPDVLDYEGNGAVVISWWEMTLRNKKSGKTNTIMQHIQHSFNEKGEIVREDYYFNPAQLPK